ncbi:hypothetical protein [Halalkalibacter urbisdiaboli]|uniref:hypothetical protein n=1 Tax=Halalkalibacter urbisdiaboli TaxID=1960589 RepID=UPI000B453570|nr:hypothetical protein [Halalkalibacter urbisdiaboli]
MRKIFLLLVSTILSFSVFTLTATAAGDQSSPKTFEVAGYGSPTECTGISYIEDNGWAGISAYGTTECDASVDLIQATNYFIVDYNEYDSTMEQDFNTTSVRADTKNYPDDLAAFESETYHYVEN